MLQVPAALVLLPVCNQVCPDITVMVDWILKKILFYFSMTRFALVDWAFKKMLFYLPVTTFALVAGITVMVDWA